MNKAVFLDRDGTVIRDHSYLAEVERVELLPGAGAALARLRAAGYLLVIVTNQSGVGRGYFSAELVDRQHERLRELLDAQGVKVAGFRYCPHAPEDACECRKPLPGMLLSAAAEFDIRLGDSFMVGDKLSDIAAGRAAGCRTVAIGIEAESADRCVPDLTAAAGYICSGAEKQEKRIA